MSDDKPIEAERGQRVVFHGTHVHVHHSIQVGGGVSVFCKKFSVLFNSFFQVFKE